jgi:hypothetical protein
LKIQILIIIEHTKSKFSGIFVEENFQRGTFGGESTQRGILEEKNIRGGES